MSGAASTHRYEALDSWRGICALIVALHHFPFPGGLTALPLVRNGYLFVDFFFVLSGFVISHAYRGDDPAGFIRRRIFRLWPLHLAMLAAFIPYEWARLLATGKGFVGANAPSTILPNALLLHGIGPAPTWNGPSWSISVEMGLYLSFVGFLTLPARWRLPLAAFGIAASLAAIGAFSPKGMNATTDFGWARGLAGFYAGYLTQQLPRLKSSTWAELAAVAVVAAFVSAPAGPLHLAAPTVFAVAVAVFASEAGAVSRALRQAEPLGRWSYSIYMTHGLLAVSIAAAVNQEIIANAAWLLPAYLAAIIAVSAASYRLIEAPGQRLGRRRVSAMA